MTSTEKPLPPKLMNQRQAALFLGVSPRTLENYRLTGEGPKWIRLGKRLVRYKLSDILNYIEDEM